MVNEAPGADSAQTRAVVAEESCSALAEALQTAVQEAFRMCSVLFFRGAVFDSFWRRFTSLEMAACRKHGPRFFYR